MIRPDVDFLARYSEHVLYQEGCVGGSVRAYTLALEMKTLLAYVAQLEGIPERVHEALEHPGFFEMCPELVCHSARMYRDGP